MPSEVFQLYLLLTLKDYASGGLNRVRAELAATGKEGKHVLQTFDSLRENLKRDLATAGVGIGTLMMLRKGVKEAADFEQAINELKLSIAEVDPSTGVENLSKLNDQLGRSQALAVRLGNTLPGSTQDFIEMMAVLKQGGMQTERMLGGGGEAVAHLAVVTHSNPAELAKEYAQVGEMFQLQTQKEWMEAADISARLFRATGIRPEEQVQGLKFAQVRAGAKLGLSGLEGYESLGRILGTLRTFGLEGGFGGRELSRFLSQLADYEKHVAKLKKTEGIDLKKWGIQFEFFDKKTHQFKGFDNLFKQMEQLRRLPEKERVIVGEKLFTAEGTAIATAFMTAGEEGWKKINNRVDAVLPLEKQIEKVTETWNTKLENVQGTLKNVTATGFQPLLKQLEPLSDQTNTVLGHLQEFLAAHSGVAQIGADFIVIGGTILTVTGGVKALINVINLARIASAVAAGESIANVGRVSLSVGTLKGMLGGLATPIKISIIATELLWVTSELRELKRLRDEFNQRELDLKARSIQSFEQNMKLPQTPGIEPSQLQQNYEMSAQVVLAQLNREKTLREQMGGGAGQMLRGLLNTSSYESGKPKVERLAELVSGGARYLSPSQWVTESIFGKLQPEQNPFWQARMKPGAYTSREEEIKLFQKRGAELQEPQVMAEFIKIVHGLKDWPEEAKQSLLDLAQKSFPTSYNAGNVAYTQSIDALSDRTRGLNEEFNKLFIPLGNVQQSFTDAGSAAQRLAGRLDEIDLRRATFTPAGAQPAPSFTFGGGKAEGGRVLKGVQYVGGERGPELFTPDLPGWIWSNEKLQAISRIINKPTQGWRSLVREDLDLLSEPFSLEPHVLKRIFRESRGNAAAVNLWDINAQQGHPSIGLMQVIQPTFDRYAGPLASRGIYDPLANIYAGLNYARSRYGSIQFAMDKPGGYDRGGWLMPGVSMAVNQTGRPEAVLTPEQSTALVKILELRRTVLTSSTDRLREFRNLHSIREFEPARRLAPAAPAAREPAADGRVHVHVTVQQYSPRVTVQGSATEKTREQIISALSEHSEELARLVAREVEIQLERK